MKNRLFLFCLLAALAVSCVKDQQEVIQMVTDDQEFFATIEEAGEPDTRVYANDQLRVRWDAGDHISIFNKTTYNREYAFQGETGDNSGSFKKVPNDDFFTGNDLDYIYAVYPYQESTKISDEGELTFILPAEQFYRENSFGLGANTMISVTEDNELHFKNLCGYFAVKLYGDNVSVKSISIKGNNNELLAGKATVIAQTDAAPTLQMDPAEATKELTLTCATPVTLGSTAETATTFWFVIPPTTFTNGFTMTVTDSNNGSFVKTTSGSLEIKRNILKKSAALQVVPIPQENLIQFEDEQTKRACVNRFDTNGDGELSYDEAAAVTSLDQTFYGNRGIQFFDEFQYFTGITSIPNTCFRDCIKLQRITLPPNLIQIGESAFRGDYNLVSVTIPEGVTTIKESAFQSCTKLPTVVLPESLLTLESSVFMDCHALVSIIIPQGVTGIGDSAFLRCEGLSTIVIPAGVTYIDDYAFGSCTGLTSIYVEAHNPPRGSRTMFRDTNNCPIYVPVESINTYKSKPNWDEYKDRIQSVPQPNNIIQYFSTDGNEVTPYKTNGFGANIVSNEVIDGQGIITFDGDVTSIGDHSFYDCTTLASITIPNSVTSLGECAFHGCSSLISISIPENVQTIGGSPFSSCTNLASITVDTHNTVFDSRDNCNAIIESSSNVLLSGCKNTIIPKSISRINSFAFNRCFSLVSIIIPDGVGSIGSNAFAFCTDLNYISIPDSVTSIEDSAFMGCTNLTSVVIPESTSTIGNGAFCNCTGLTSINIPDGISYIEPQTFSGCESLLSIIIPDSVSGIGYSAFSACKSLSSITIPRNVTSIESSAFAACHSLTSITVMATNPPTGDSHMFSDTNSCPIYVPFESLNTYKSAYYWSDYADRIQAMPQPNNKIYYTSTDGNIVTPYNADSFGANLISNEVLEGNGTLVFDSEITNIGYQAFFYCTSLETISIPQSVSEIGQSAFSNCSSLLSVSIPEGVTSIQRNAFSECSNLSYVSIPNSVTTIGTYSFTGCSSLSSVTIPESVVSIARYSFQRCTSLTSIIIPKGVTFIGTSAFLQCESLQFIYVMPLTPPVNESSFFDISGCPIYVPKGSVEAYKSSSNWSLYSNRIQAIPSSSSSVPEAVDLGLSVKWASFNLGASKPEEYGDYYAWGEIIPKEIFSWETYKWCNGTSDSLTKYNRSASQGSVDNKTTLDPEDDAAHVLLGGNWRMPTIEELIELEKNCTSQYTTENGVPGYRITSRKEGYSDKSIFFPLAGFKTGNEFKQDNSYYWSSSLYPYADKSHFAGIVKLQDLSGGSRSYWDRYRGIPIRPVCPKD